MKVILLQDVKALGKKGDVVMYLLMSVPIVSDVEQNIV